VTTHAPTQLAAFSVDVTMGLTFRMMEDHAEVMKVMIAGINPEGRDGSSQLRL
jgi:hypothetical protein